MKIFLRAASILCLLSFSAVNLQSQSTRAWTTEIGAGLAMTNGNSDTKNINVSVGLIRDTKTRNLFRFNGIYLRGDKDGTLIINQTAFTGRDEVSMSTRTFVFFQGAFLKDTFKNINYLVSPTAGIGFKLINSDTTLLSLDTGLGGVWERDIGRNALGQNFNQDTKATGAYNAAERLIWKMSPNTAVTQSLGSLWKTNDWADSIHNFSAGIAASLTQRTQMKLEFLDTFKNRPPVLGVKKNDTAVITSLVVKF